ncbi:DUF2608 domain-containing protein [Aliiglaciecola sp. LCG003]|uniref:DUF2608 domain-containing protein n=1 Tax=Aliiglaciecola sp. LCG003 TaxID=3053655 RepID=UPI0025732E0A|nr:DUF2608 domain-containing protein [Aliiglaciecola sp. LCG003]WJG08873.1 DUF2608 domain-containing protein [Aliiglaciecola sp. LCG003]
MKLNLSSYLPIVFSTLFISSCAVVSQDAQLNPVATRVVKQETLTFADVVSETTELSRQYGAKNVLIVMDIDNTILTSSTDLGSDVWYQWQTGKLDVKPSPAQKVSCLFEDSIGLLYELSPMRLTEDRLNSTIVNWQNTGHTLVALTSRAPQYRAATERELIRNQVNLSASALVPLGQDTLIFREMKGRELSYMQGVMMTSGMNKGEMLQYLLDKADREFAAIVFVDDSKKNIDDVYRAYKDAMDLDMRIFHYTRIEDLREKEFGKVLTQEQADNMAQQWQQLNTTLQQLFPARKLAQGCLTL